MRLQFPNIFVVIIICFAVLACNSSSENEAVISSYSDSLLVVRKANNKDLKNNKRSPIAKSKRERFVGLNYFIPQEAWKLVAEIERLPENKVEQIATSTGEIRSMVPYAILKFKKENEAFELTGYSEINAHSNELFIPFYDATNAKETYAGGRYLNVVLPPGDCVIVDFNLAYNPYCHYNENYSCPIPPIRNTLTTAVLAGEKVLFKN
ncbi:MAG: hypothetical protein ACI85Q_001212 [Salibacteraceae bacterium]|jgi:uncharacterized protein (DUF1684 family)